MQQAKAVSRKFKFCSNQNIEFANRNGTIDVVSQTSIHATHLETSRYTKYFEVLLAG